MADPSEAIAPAAEAEVNPASSDGAAPMTLESVLATLASDVAAGSHSAAVLRECYLAQQQVSTRLHQGTHHAGTAQRVAYCSTTQ